MTSVDFSMTAFALLNAARIVAYVPQIICVRRDRNGAAGVSLVTWGLFTLANLATVSYALTVSSDRFVAGVFALNTLGCFAIFALTAIKRILRSGRRHPQASSWWSIESGRADL